MGFPDILAQALLQTALQEKARRSPYSTSQFDGSSTLGSQELGVDDNVGVFSAASISRVSKDSIGVEIPLLLPGSSVVFPWKASYSNAGVDYLVGDRQQVEVPGQEYDVVGFTALGRPLSAYVVAERNSLGGGQIGYRAFGFGVDWATIEPAFMPWRYMDFFSANKKTPRITLNQSETDPPPSTNT